MTQDTREKLSELKEWVGRGILAVMAVAGWMVAREIGLATEQMVQVKESVNALNVSMATFSLQLSMQTSIQQDHEVRIRELERK